MKSCSLLTQIFTILFALGLSQQASAMLFAPTLSYITYKEDTLETSSTMADLRLGTMLNSTVYVGAIYDIQRDDSGGADTSTWGLGPSAGIFINNFSFIFSYYIMSERTTPLFKYNKGSGPQVDIAYAFDLGGVKAGPQVTWREQQWVLPTEKTVSTFRPYFAIFFEF